MKLKTGQVRALNKTLMVAFLVSFLVAPEAALPQTPFYHGKTVTIIQGRDPGGTGDLRVKALFPFLQKYIPGNPTIVSEYMPGGGSRKAANHIYRSARPDGLTIGNLSSGMVSLAILGESGVLYDIDKFFYLGSPYSTYHAVFVSRKQAGLSSIQKLQAASGIKIGAQSVGFSTYNEGRLFAYLLGLKEPKFIAAYGGAELDPALMRGEIDARATGPDTILSVTLTGSKRVWWTFTRSWKLPRAISTLIRSSAIFPRSRALPDRTENARSLRYSVLLELAAPPLFFLLPHLRIG